MHSDLPKAWDLLSIYQPTPGTRIPSIMIHLEDWNIYSGMVINESQRQACRRLFKRMAKGPIVKVHVNRWVTMG